MKIPLLNSNKVILIDRKDNERVSKFKWYLNHGYVRRSSPMPQIFLHRFIMQPTPEVVVDHKNHDLLDNRRKSLRICSVAENHHNTVKHRTNTTGYKGVSLSTSKLKPFEAKIRVNGIKKYLGCFESAVSAALAYNTAARYYFGDFAFLNGKVEQKESTNPGV